MRIRQLTRRIQTGLALLLGFAVCASACTEDTIGTFGPPDETTEVGMPDMGVREDARYVPDTNIDNETPAVPASPAETAYCNDDNWCWLHPAPIPQKVTDLQRVGDQIFGVVKSNSLQGFQRVIWKDDSMALAAKPVPPTEELADMSTSEDGWLALGREGKVYDIGPNGVRATRQLPVDLIARGDISGRGIDTFVVQGAGADVHVMREGRLSTHEPAQGLPMRRSFMWKTGEILGVSKGGDHQSGEYENRLDGQWEIFPLAITETGEEYSAIGPRPGSSCASEGMFVGTTRPTFSSIEGYLYRWDELAKGFADVAYDGSGIKSIGCSVDGDLLLTNEESELLEQTGKADPFWETTKVTDEEIEDTRVLGSKLYASSTQGDHAVISDAETLRLGTGFRIPTDLQPPDEILGYYSHIWVNDSADTITLSHDRGVFVGDEDGWRRMPADEPAGVGGVKDARVWGFETPKFATSSGTLWRWDGDFWVSITQETFGESYVPIAKIISFAADDMWMRADGNIFHHDGSEWANVSAPGSSLSILLEAEDLEMNRLFGTDDGRLLFGADGSLHRLIQDAENWSIELVTDTPCDLVGEVLRADDGTLWIVGRDTECIASHSDGNWTTYTWPTDDQAPPDTRSSDDSVEWVRQPTSEVPVLVTDRGVLEPQSDGTLRSQFIGRARDAAYVESMGVTLVLTDLGVVANYE